MRIDKALGLNFHPRTVAAGLVELPIDKALPTFELCAAWHPRYSDAPMHQWTTGFAHCFLIDVIDRCDGEEE